MNNEVIIMPFGVARTQAEHDMFCQAMRERGVEVFEAEELLAQALAKAEARDWVCGHILSERQVGVSAAQRAREWAGSAEPALVAEFLIGGITRADVRRDVGLEWESADPTSMLLPPLPNFPFQRDPSCWIYDGVTLNPMTKPARKPETMIMETIYRFHPMFAAEKFPAWLGTPSKPSASSGTTATTSSRSNPAWSSATSATPARTPRCARPASR